MRCVIYSRVSTDAQEREGTSLDTQEAACLEYARQQGWPVVETLRDTASGFSLDRPGMERARSMAASGRVDVLLAHSLDRLSRKQTHVAILVEEMEDRGVALDFVTEDFEDTAVGQLVRSVKAFAAEFEREKIAERTMRGKRERARSGKLPQGTGAGLYGYRYDKTTGQRRIIDAQAAVVRRIFETLAAGGSIVGLVNALNREAVPTKTGRHWTPATVHHMLRNEAYSGRTYYGKTKASQRNGRRIRERRPEADWIEVPGATPPILDRDLFSRVQSILDDPERRRMGRRKRDYALSGRLRCRECGRAMVGQTQHGKYRYYRCRAAYAGPRRDRCSSRYVRADALEEAVRQAATEALTRPEIVLRELEHAVTGAPPDTAVQRARLERQRERVLRLFQLGEIDEDYLTKETADIGAQLDALDSPLDEQPLTSLPRDVVEICEAIAAWIRDADGDDFKLLLEALQIEVRASREGSELRGVIPNSAPTDSHADVCAVGLKSGSAGTSPSITISPRRLNSYVPGLEHEVEVIAVSLLDPVSNGLYRTWHPGFEGVEVHTRLCLTELAEFGI